MTEGTQRKKREKEMDTAKISGSSIATAKF
jgi:hypothetical protein